MAASWLSASRVFCAQVMQEARRVVWPTRRDVVLTSIIVFVVAFIFSVFLMIVDQVIFRLMQVIFGGM